MISIDCIISTYSSSFILKSHDDPGFIWYVSENLLGKYSYECRNLVCYACDQNN